MQRHADHPGRCCAAYAGAALAQQKKDGVDPILVNKAIEKSWTTVAPDWQSRLDQDETQKVCSQYRNSPAGRRRRGDRRARAGGDRLSPRRQADGRLEERREAGRERLRRPVHGLSRRASPTAATATPATSWPRRRSATARWGRASWSTARSASIPRPISRPSTSASTIRMRPLRAQTCHDWVPASSLPLIRFGTWWRMSCLPTAR